MKHFHNERGSALMAAFWMLVVLLLAGLASSYITSTELSLAGNERVSAELFYLAEAAIAQTKKYLDGMGIQFEGTGAARTAPRMVYEEEPIGAPGGVSGFFTAYVDPKNNQTGKPTKYLAITVRAWITNNPMVKVIQERVGQENFARFAYFTDEETMVSGTEVWFRTGDILRGPVHSNSQFNINGDPIFIKEVTTIAPDVNYGGPSNPDFREGITFSVNRIELPTDTDKIRAKAFEPEGLFFSGNADLTLAFDPVTLFASVDVDQGAGGVVYQIPDNGVLYVDGDVTIWGTLSGQLTVACSGDIYIVNDLLYTTDPRVDPESTDLLGLIADGNIIMADTAANLDAGDETVMAVMMALGTSFTAQNYSAGTPRGYLRIIGGVIQARRGPVGTFNPSTLMLVTGYDKDYVWDSRLADNPPPSFPTTGKVLTLAWREMDPSHDISSDVF